jgi:error-prone DNA polymerase
MPLPEHVKADYQSTGLSLKAHPLRFLRPELARSGHITCAQAATLPNNARFQITGIVLVRQRPGSANGVVFATIEDETGTANVVVWPSLLETHRSAVLGSALLYIKGTIQRSPEGITHLVAEHLENHTAKLTLTDLPTTPGDELPRSRDFR